MTSLTVGQIIGLNNVLTVYPMDSSFKDIFDAIYRDDESITIQDYFYEWDANALYEFVNNLANNIDKEIKLAMK